MARDFSRTDRVAGVIARKLSELLQMEVQDPRVQFITISDVSVTRDLMHAKVYFTVMNEQAPETVLQGLNRAKSFLRKRLAESVQMRATPELHFHYDKSSENAQRIDQLLKDALAKHPVEESESIES